MNAIRPMSAELEEVLAENLEIIEVPKKQMLLKDGETCDYIYVVITGLLRMYYIKEDQEICSRFMEEGKMAMSVNSFYSRTPGYEFIETVESSVIARIHYDRLQRIYTQQDSFNYIARVITEHYFVRSEERIFLLRKRNAEERYQYFVDNYPDLLQRLPLTYIASYLGLTLETLSRIRKKLSVHR